MSFRFLAGCGPEALLGDLEARMSTIPDLLLRSRRAGLRVWTDPAAPCLVSEDGSSFLIGLLVDRASGRAMSALNPGVSAEASFTALHWGAYALLRCGPEGTLEALRDPSGTVPVFYASQGPLRLFASAPDLMRAASLAAWQPDLHFVRHWLTFPFLRTARTGVAGMSELLPGAKVVAGQEPSAAWTPWAHVRRRPGLSVEEAAKMLRQELLRSIPALLPKDSNIVLQLSGGLDSSIIGAALANAGRRFTALTFATRAADGDERLYARAAASRFGAELVELVEDEVPPDFEALSAPAFRPPPTALLRPYEQAVTNALGTLGARWVVNGAGGDNLFVSLNSAAPALDALRLDGLGPAATALGDLATLHNATRWHVLRLAARKALRPRSAPWRRDERFLLPGATLPAIDPHPWLPPPRDALPGKREHVASLIGIQHFLAQRPAGAAGLFPLLSQPLLELGLSIPTHLWITGGRNRAVAREAVRGLVPDLILARRGKGRLESMFMRGYMQGRGQIEALLLDGELRARGFIDADAVSSYLRQPGQPSDAGYTRLLEMAACETWLHSFRA